jgi:hypothetical protein
LRPDNFVETPTDQERGEAMTHLAFNVSCSIVALLGTCASAVADDARTGSAAYGDWQTDAAGVMRKITVGDLPQPMATPSARNFSKVRRAASPASSR